jgi:predicted nucleic acid-binding protein
VGGRRAAADLTLVVDASVLIGELLRTRGQVLLNHPDRTLSQSSVAASETSHELRRRGQLMIQRGHVDEELVQTLLDTALAFVSARVVQVAASEYAALEHEARRRVPRDPNDWTLVALALHLGGVPILTLDHDFLGCGLPTWTPETLRAHLGL